jgi:hypothetical protein
MSNDSLRFDGKVVVVTGAGGGEIKINFLDIPNFFFTSILSF